MYSTYLKYDDVIAARVAATIERCAQWHDKQEELMVEAGDLIAAEWHRDSAAAIRAMKD